MKRCYTRIWVDNSFHKKIKVEAAKKGVSILKLTKNLDLQLDEDKFKKDRKKSMYSSQWVNL
jgi:hypothetical protein